MTVEVALPPKRSSSLRLVGRTGFWHCEAVSKDLPDHQAGKDVSPRQVADALTFIREIRVFPPLTQTFTKNHQRPNAEASSGESVGFAERSGSGTEQSTLSRPARPRKI